MKNNRFPIRCKSFPVILVTYFIMVVACNGKSVQKTNIVWLIAEDLSPDLGCYGHPLVKTPNIDKLADQGIRFENAFATCPVCSPSRSAFFTGVYQTTIASDYHDTMEKNKLPLPEGIKTLPDIFYEAGYFVDYHGKTHFNFKYEGLAIKDRDWHERKEQQPFFLVLQTHHTHRPFTRDTIRPVDPAKIEIPPCYPDHEITRRDWADYLEDVQHLDDWVGEQMNWLESNNLLDNTVVVFFGDHGRPHVRGKQFLYDEGLQVPLIIAQFNKNRQKGKVKELVSLIDLAPTMLQLAGMEVPNYMHGLNILSEIDREHIFASRSRMGDAIDKMRCIRTEDYLFIKNFMPEKPWMQLSSYKKRSYPVYTLLEVLHEKDQLTDEQAYFMTDTKPEYELYNVKKDPFQLNNLAETNPELVADFSKMLEKWQAETNDHFDDPDQPDLEEMIAGKRAGLRKWYLDNGLSENPSNEEVLNLWKKKLDL
jgi:N-sulfoglucosamine sulfohydrolase